MRREKHSLLTKVKSLETKLAAVMKTTSVNLDEETSSDIQTIMEEEEQHINSFSEDSFQYLFWKQQKEAVMRVGTKKNGIRWHPLVLIPETPVEQKPMKHLDNQAVSNFLPSVLYGIIPMLLRLEQDFLSSAYRGCQLEIFTQFS